MANRKNPFFRKGQNSLQKSKNMTDILSTQQNDKEFQVLQNIHHHNKIRQRDLAAAVGMSLGLTNTIVKRLVTKGLLTIRKINNRNIMYAVSPAGMEEIARRSYKYFKKTVKNIVNYKDSIDALIREVKESGFSAISLVGTSDVDFIVEHICGKYDVVYTHQTDDLHIDEGSFVLYGENWKKSKNNTSCFQNRETENLRDILVRI